MAVFRRVVRKMRQALFSSGTAYGLLLGLSFALFTWGYDGLQLARNHADLPWSKLLLGLPLSLATGTLLGWLGTLASSGLFSAALGGLVGGFLAWVASHMPYEGATLAVWLSDRRLWGLPMYPFGPSAQTRMWLVIVIGVGLGVAAGYLQLSAMEWAWNRSTPQGRMTLLSWVMLLVCVPLMLPLASAIDELVDAPLRAPQTQVGTTVGLVLAGKEEQARARGLDYDAVQQYQDKLTPDYTVHLAYFDPQALFSAYVEVIFDNGLALRCGTVRDEVTYCEDVGLRREHWWDDLVRAGLTGERRWLGAKPITLVVYDEVVGWLQAHADQLQGNYHLELISQHGGWLLLAARFDSGFEVMCRFHGAVPAVVDHCEAAGSAVP